MAAEDRRTWLDFFADELRAWRERREMTQEQLAKLISYSPSTVAMVETATRKPKPDFIRRCDEALDTGGALMRLYDELVSRELAPDWLDRWRRIEDGAVSLNYFEIFVIPGILQTSEYAAAGRWEPCIGSFSVASSTRIRFRHFPLRLLRAAACCSPPTAWEVPGAAGDNRS